MHNLAPITAAFAFGQVPSSSTSTAFTATVPGVSALYDGLCVYLKNGVITSASGWTLNVNSLGAKPVYSTLASADRTTTLFNVNYTMLVVYNSSRVSGGCWDMYLGYNSERSPATASPSMDGTAAVGTSVKYAREDHVHPSDTSRLAKSGDTMTGAITLASNKYYEQNNAYGIHANNSDVIGVNGFYFGDLSDDGREGINFYRDSTHWDSLFAKNGVLYFSPNREKNTAGTDGNAALYS